MITSRCTCAQWSTHTASPPPSPLQWPSEGLALPRQCVRATSSHYYGMPACADCGQVHDGVSDPADGEFYCHSCWAQFVIVPEKKGGMMCTICEVHVPAGKGDQLLHIKGKKHLQRLSEQSAAPPAMVPRRKSLISITCRSHECILCYVSVT